MQPAIINSKPGPTTNAAGELQLDIGEDDPPDSADKPASSHLSSAHRSSSLASTQTITPAIAILSLQTSNSNDGLRPTFCTGDSTPRAGFGAATPNGDGNGTVPLASCGIATTALSGTAPIAIDKYPHHQHHQHPPRSTATPSSLSTSAGTGTTMLGCASAGSSNSDSDSPASTMPPSSEQSSPPPSCPGSRPGSRKSSFSERANGTAHKPASINGSEGGGAHHSSGGGQRFTLKDLLASGPKVARKPSQSSRKSDTSSDRGGYAESTTASLLKKYGVCEKIAIGKGATSVVRLAHKWDRSEEKLYAVKEFRKRRKNETEKEYVKKLTAEFCISSTLHHTNIVETVDLVQDEQHHWCEVMEYCPGGDLYAAIKKGQMCASEIECCFKQLLTGVAYLHSQGVAHRDIKPENLYFDTRGHLKIGDYGASTVYRLPWETTVHMSTGLCGSEPYIAPEQFLRKPYDARLVDIWAVGIVYYCLLFQELPWRVAQFSDSLFAAYQTACVAAPFKVSVASSTATAPTFPSSRDCGSRRREHMSTFPPTINNIGPREARPLLRRILEPDPKLRANVQEIMDNAWVKSIEVCTEVKKPSHKHTNIHSSAPLDDE